VSVFATQVPGKPLQPPGAPGSSVGVAGAAGGSPIPGLPALPPALTAPRFPPTSRYSGVEIVQFVDATGRAHPYLRRRFVPNPDVLGQIGRYAVEDGDRIDRIAAATIGDPEQFWRLCDGNRVMDPTELEGPPGRILRVTLPAGVPAPSADA
jgi:hypothetical protein